jgi:hypothetical protein
MPDRFVEAMFAANLFCGDGFSETREAGGMVTARQLGMVEVKGDGAAMDQFAAAAQVVEPRADVGVFADTPSGVVFIEAVDGDEVVAPKGHVAPDNAALFGVAADDGKRPADAFGRAGDLSDQHPLPDRGFSSFKSRNKFFADETSAALNPKSALGQRGVIGDEL